MRISKTLLLINLCALLINALFLFLAMVKAFPPALPLVIFLMCLAGLVWASCKLNGLPPTRLEPFHAAVTEQQRIIDPDVQVVPLQGGLFIWVHLPKDVSSVQLLLFALEEGVEYAPGPRFFPQSIQGVTYLRLNFATQILDDLAGDIHLRVPADTGQLIAEIPV